MSNLLGWRYCCCVSAAHLLVLMCSSGQDICLRVAACVHKCLCVLCHVCTGGGAAAPNCSSSCQAHRSRWLRQSGSSCRPSSSTSRSSARSETLGCATDTGRRSALLWAAQSRQMRVSGGCFPVNWCRQQNQLICRRLHSLLLTCAFVLPASLCVTNSLQPEPSAAAWPACSCGGH